MIQAMDQLAWEIHPTSLAEQAATKAVLGSESPEVAPSHDTNANYPSWFMDALRDKKETIQKYCNTCKALDLDLDVLIWRKRDFDWFLAQAKIESTLTPEQSKAILADKMKKLKEIDLVPVEFSEEEMDKVDLKHGSTDYSVPRTYYCYRKEGSQTQEVLIAGFQNAEDRR